jgi:ketosteroid isomerase-like protein
MNWSGDGPTRSTPAISKLSSCSTSGDIVKFDVPPPDAGVRGLEAYRGTWPPFFDWQRSGGSFEIDELDITAGEDVAYAWALLRCATASTGSGKPAIDSA